MDLRNFHLYRFEDGQRILSGGGPEPAGILIWARNLEKRGYRVEIVSPDGEVVYPTRADLFVVAILIFALIACCAWGLSNEASQNTEEILKAIREKKDA
jgi:hypothetical protein